MLYSCCSLSGLASHTRSAGILRKRYRFSILDSGLDGGWPTMLLASVLRRERFRFPVQTNAADGGIRPGNPTGDAPFRLLCPPYPFNVKGLRGAFQRGRLRTHFAFRRRLFPKLNCVLSGSSHALRCLRKPPGTGKPDLTRGTL